MRLIVKKAAEQMPMIFDFVDRLGELAPGARIAEILAITVDPTGHADDLDVGELGDAIIDQVTELAVQVVATEGRLGQFYTATCRAAVQHAGNDYTLEVDLPVLVE